MAVVRKNGSIFAHTFFALILYITYVGFRRDNNLNINEFSALLKALFRNEKGKPYPMDAYMCNELFSIFNISGVSTSSQSCGSLSAEM